MACVNDRKMPVIWNTRHLVSIVSLNVFMLITLVSCQLDLPPIGHSSSPRPTDPYYNQYGVSSPRTYNNQPVTQYNGPYSSTQRPGVYSTTPTRYPQAVQYDTRYRNYNQQGINPDIINRGVPISREGFSSRQYENGNVDHINEDDRSRNVDYQGRNPNLYPDDLNGNNNYGGTVGSTTDRATGNRYRTNGGNPYVSRNTLALRSFLSQIDSQASEECNNNVAAQWNFETDVNELTQLSALEAQQRYSDFQRGVWQSLRGIRTDSLIDWDLYRQLRYLSAIGPAALPPDQLDRYNRLINDMLAVYNAAEICAYNDPFKCGLRLQPDLTTIMARSRDWEELQHVWTEWRRNTGLKFRDLYEQLADLTNQAAKLNNFTNAAEYWTFPFESPTFRLDVDEAWEQVRPLYEQLHAYVRRKLRDLHGPERISRSAPLPAHVLGNMWGQSWTNILDFTIPYPGKTFLDVTPEMIQQGYTPSTMFQLADEFFTSMNMTALPPQFWEGSILERPPDRDINCQPSAWDFCNGIDYRIKMCTQVSMKDLVTAHHEVSHIQYFLQYRNKPKVYRDGANPGFHEAIGEAIALSVSSPRHLQTLGLVQRSVDDLAHDTNFLFALAMDKVPFLPFSLIMDKWRWGVFSKDVRKEQYNCHWWRLREEYSGIKPPVLRSELDFDPGSKYHIPANIPYIRYFVSTILQFQIHRAMCKAAGQYVEGDPNKLLHKCDIYRSVEAGNVLKNLMKPGSSVPWNKVLFDATNDVRLDGGAMREYFRPLETWLRNENLRNGEYVGWTYDGDYCKFSIETAGLQVFGGFYSDAPSIFNATHFWAIFLASFLGTVIMSRKYN